MIAKQGKRDEVRYRWNLPDGALCRITVFDVTTSEAEEAARACGWPGREPLSS